MGMETLLRKAGKREMALLIEKQLTQQFGDTGNPVFVVRAPGRVNMIGEHTDYNDGFVFPAAIDKYITIAGSLRSDRLLQLYSADFDEIAQFSLDAVIPDQGHPWANYVAGVTQLFLQRGLPLCGMNLAISGTIPQGAGLSSSAALEMATAYIIQALHQLELSPVDTIQLCQRAENEFVGVNCGIMDQYISCLGEKGSALLIDCRSLEATPIPLLQPGVKLVVTNTKVKHSLVDSAYNRRRAECEEAATFFAQRTGKQVPALRDVSPEEFTLVGAELPENLRKRAMHVIFENQRVLAGVEALKAGDLPQFGSLMYQSHTSLQNLYEVSCAELDLLVTLARKVEGVYGSRMTGGGFGGCTVTLIRAEAIESFITYLGEKYTAKTGITPEFYICDVVDGAHRKNRR